MAHQLIGLLPTATSTSAEFKLGQEACDSSGREFIYVEADAAITAGMCCIIHGDFGAQGVTAALVALDAGVGKMCGVALVDIASGSFGWLARKGTGSDFLVDLGAAAADFGLLGAHASDVGALIDYGTPSDTVGYIEGIVITTASGGAEQEICILDYPHVSLTPVV